MDGARPKGGSTGALSLLVGSLDSVSLLVVDRFCDQAGCVSGIQSHGLQISAAEQPLQRRQMPLLIEKFGFRWEVILSPRLAVRRVGRSHPGQGLAELLSALLTPGGFNVRPDHTCALDEFINGLVELDPSLLSAILLKGFEGVDRSQQPGAHAVVEEGILRVDEEGNGWNKASSAPFEVTLQQCCKVVFAGLEVTKSAKGGRAVGCIVGVFAARTAERLRIVEVEPSLGLPETRPYP